MALQEYPHIEKLFLVGDTPQIEAELKQHRLQRRPHRNRPRDAGRRDERWRRRGGPAEEGFLRQPRGRSGEKRRRGGNRQRGPHRRGGGRHDDQAAHAAGRRSPGHRGRDSIGDQHLRLDRRRREQRRARGAPAAIRHHGLGLFPARPRLQKSGDRPDVDRRRRRERERPDQGSLQDAQAKRAQFSRQHRRPRPFCRPGRGGGLRRFCRQRHSENLRIDRATRFSNGSSTS